LISLLVPASDLRNRPRFKTVVSGSSLVIDNEIEATARAILQ
jgi:hypothetical protein